MTEVRQYYFDVNDGQFSNNGHNIELSGKIGYCARDHKSLGRKEQLILSVMQENYGCDFRMGEQIEGLDLREAYSEIRYGVIGLFSEVLSPEESERFLESSKRYFVVLYDLDHSVHEDPLQLGFGRNTWANVMGIKNPDIYINLHSLARLRREVEEIIMEMRQNGEEVTSEDQEKLIKHFITQDVKVSLAHELLHWLKRLVSESGSENEGEETIIEGLAWYIFDPANKNASNLSQMELANFLDKN